MLCWRWWLAGIRWLGRDMGKKTKKPGKGKEKAAKAEEKRSRRETRSSHLRMTSMPLWYMGQRILHDRLVHGSKKKNNGR
ncbi:unnamed protein product, partial [Prunus brigantina]